MMNRWPGALLALLVLSAAAPASAQRPGGPPGPGPEELRERVQARFLDMAQRRLELDDVERQRLEETLDAFHERRRDLARREAGLRRELASLDGPGATSAPPERARELLERLVELKLEEARLFATEQEELLGVLRPGQVLELHRLREEMARRIRAMRRGRGRRGGPPGVEEAAWGLHGPPAPLFPGVAPWVG